MTRDDVTSALDGDRSQLRALVEQLTPAIRAEVGHALLRRGRRAGRDPRQEVDDLVHEVFVRLFKDEGKLLRAWDPARGRGLHSYARLVARSHVSTIMRSARRNPWTEEPTEAEAIDLASRPTDDQSRRLESADTLRHVLDQLEARLDERGMLLFRMLWIEECSVAEACAATGMSRDAIYAWRSRVRKLFAQLFAEHASTPEKVGA